MAKRKALSKIGFNSIARRTFDFYLLIFDFSVGLEI